MEICVGSGIHLLTCEDAKCLLDFATSYVVEILLFIFSGVYISRVFRLSGYSYLFGGGGVVLFGASPAPCLYANARPYTVTILICWSVLLLHVTIQSNFYTIIVSFFFPPQFPLLPWSEYLGSFHE